MRRIWIQERDVFHDFRVRAELGRGRGNLRSGLRRVLRLYELFIARSHRIGPGYNCDVNFYTNGTICRDPRSGSINIHEKREKNPSEKPEVA